MALTQTATTSCNKCSITSVKVGPLKKKLRVGFTVLHFQKVVMTDDVYLSQQDIFLKLLALKQRLASIRSLH